MGEPEAAQCSIVKIEANRRNAKKSTGPKTAEGKAASRSNALKHGLLSKEVVIQEGAGKEDENEFANLILDLLRDCDPQGALEETLVKKMAECLWRLKRVVRCENGEIRRGFLKPKLALCSTPERDSISDHHCLPPRGPMERILRYRDGH